MSPFCWLMLFIHHLILTRLNGGFTDCVVLSNKHMFTECFLCYFQSSTTSGTHYCTISWLRTIKIGIMLCNSLSTGRKWILSRVQPLFILSSRTMRLNLSPDTSRAFLAIYVSYFKVCASSSSYFWLNQKAHLCRYVSHRYKALWLPNELQCLIDKTVIIKESI